MGTKWNEYLLTQLERSNKDLLIQKEAERETYDKRKDYSQEEINNAIAQGIVKEKDYFMSLANAYPGGAGIASEMSAISDYEIQQKYGSQMTLIEDRTFVINQNSPFVDTIMLRLIILMHWEMQLVEYVQVGFEINMLILQ